MYLTPNSPHNWAQWSTAVLYLTVHSHRMPLTRDGSHKHTWHSDESSIVSSVTALHHTALLFRKIHRSQTTENYFQLMLRNTWTWRIRTYIVWFLDNENGTGLFVKKKKKEEKKRKWKHENKPGQCLWCDCEVCASERQSNVIHFFSVLHSPRLVLNQKISKNKFCELLLQLK